MKDTKTILVIRWKGTTMPKLEQEFEEMLGKYGLEFVGSGYDLRTRERTLDFRSPLPTETQAA